MDKMHSNIYVTKAFLPPMEEYIEKIKSIWDTHLLTNCGPLHNELENKLSDYLNVGNCSLFVNGHLALDCAIKSLKLQGEVITTPFTFASTTHAIVSNGLKPVFCDIKLDDFTIDENQIENLITKDTCAIVAVHVFGYPCNVDKIEEIANKYNLKVIYDAAHAFGVKIGDIGIGNFGDISMFSMHATKVYNTIEGGLLTYKDPLLKDLLYLSKNFGISGPESVELVGLNAKMNEFQAAMGLINLNYIDSEIQKRKNITNIYKNELQNIEGIYYLKDKENIKHNYSYFPIIINEDKLNISRDKLFEELKKYNIFARKYFYPLITDFYCYKDLYDDTNLKNARYIANNVITLPMYSDLSKDETVQICSIIKYIINKKTK